ncbi:hypothetical protein BKA80DRAFT_257326 [Phyllosticta citrichinensis]
MPRQGRGSAAPRRSAPAPAPARPSAPAPAPQQHRPATTAAHPPAATPQQPHPPAGQAPSQGPGLFGQMASTAAMMEANTLNSGVAVGSSIGHAIGGFFGGGGSSAPAEAAPQAPAESSSNAYQAPKVCETDITNFKQCMDQNEGSLTICGWYLEQLKACQQAASRY